MESEFILEEKCQLARVTQDVLNNCRPFSCGDEDLDDFFANKTHLNCNDKIGSRGFTLQGCFNVRRSHRECQTKTHLAKMYKQHMKKPYICKM